MGVYDSVFVKCPDCRTENEFQSKSGECILGSYTEDDAPAAVLLDVNRHSPCKCSGCGNLYVAQVRMTATVTGMRA